MSAPRLPAIVFPTEDSGSLCVLGPRARCCHAHAYCHVGKPWQHADGSWARGGHPGNWGYGPRHGSFLMFPEMGKAQNHRQVSLVVGKPKISVGPGEKMIGKDQSLRMCEIRFVSTWAQMENMMTMAFASTIFSNSSIHQKGEAHTTLVLRGMQ